MRRPLLLVLLLLGCPSWAWAQVGFLQAVPGTPRPLCTSIPAPVKNQTWCADASNGPGSYLWKVWNGVSYVTVGGTGGSPGLPFNAIQFNDAGTFGGDADFTWNKTTNTLAIPAGQYLSTATAGVSPNNISRFTHPGDLVEPVLGNMVVQSATTPATDKHVVLGSFDLLSTTGSFASGKLFRDRVALYSGITAVGGAQSGNIWSYNSDTTQEAASGDYFAIGAEIDFTNNNVDRGDADGEIGLSGFFSAPIFVDSLSTKRSTAFIFLSGLNSPKMWNRGVVICCDAISATGSAFQDLTDGDKSVDIRGNPNYGIFQANGGVRNFFGGDVQLVGSSLQMFEPTYTFHVDIGASVALAQNMLYLWPSVPGTAGQVLTTDGSGGFQTMTWTTVGGGGAIPLNQIVVGTGAGTTGFADFTWVDANQYFVAGGSAPPLLTNNGVRAVTINTAGTGYVTGEFISISGGDGLATVLVIEVSGPGGILDARLLYPGTGYALATNVATSGGGSGFTVDITDITGVAVSPTLTSVVSAEGTSFQGTTPLDKSGIYSSDNAVIQSTSGASNVFVGGTTFSFFRGDSQYVGQIGANDGVLNGSYSAQAGVSNAILDDSLYSFQGGVSFSHILNSQYSGQSGASESYIRAGFYAFQGGVSVSIIDNAQYSGQLGVSEGTIRNSSAYSAMAGVCCDAVIHNSTSSFIGGSNDGNIFDSDNAVVLTNGRIDTANGALAALGGVVTTATRSMAIGPVTVTGSQAVVINVGGTKTSSDSDQFTVLASSSGDAPEFRVRDSDILVGDVGHATTVSFMGSTSGYVALAATATPSGYTLFLPAADGGANTPLITDGAGTLSFAAGVTQNYVVCTGAACATSCTLQFTGGILTGSSGTCP